MKITRSALRRLVRSAETRGTERPRLEEKTVHPLPAADPQGAPKHIADVDVLVRRTHDLLASRVPLTLLIDLGEAGGPRSTARYEAEGGDAASWLPRPRQD